MAEPKSGAEMIGDFLREASVLVVVFCPLESMVSGGLAALTAPKIFVTVGIAGGLLVAGMVIERIRE